MNLMDRLKKNRERVSVEATARGTPRGAHMAAVLPDLGPQVRGSVRIEMRPAGDKAWETVHEDHNLVVTQAENLLANMAAGTANAEIGYIELGDPVLPTPPALTDTNLQTTTAERKAVTPVVSGSQVEFTATWLVGDGNGFTFTEAGLFTNPLGAGTMFARKSGFSVVKTLSFELRFTWTLRFDVSSGGGTGCSGIAVVGPATITDDYLFTAAGAETQVVVAFDFVVGAKHLDVFLNGQRLVYSLHYTEATIGLSKGINLVSPLIAADEVYFVQRRIV